MDNFMDKLVEKINAQGASRNQSAAGIQDNPRGLKQEKGIVTEEKLRAESAKLIEAVAAQINDGNAKQVELLTEYKQQSEEAVGKTLEAAKDSLADHVHKESVKCYRNTQAVIEEKTTAVSENVQSGLQGIRGLLIAAIVLLVLNLGVAGVMLAHMFGVF